MEHTPEPWEVVDHKTEPCQIKSKRADLRICDVWCTDFPHGKANARLIAAAPELLEALEEIFRICEGPVGDLLTGDSMNDTGLYDGMYIVKAAIAKAKGAE